MPDARFVRRYLGLGTLALLLSGCTATHYINNHVSNDVNNGKGTIEQRVSPRDAVTFERLDPQPYTPADWPQALNAQVLLPNTQGVERRPAALIVHGGGWRNRSPNDMQGIAEQLAEQGYVTVNIEYRFAPEYQFPAQLYDLQQAMAWIHSHAEEWRVDTDRVVGVGYSSGAHLVSLLAVAGAEGPLSIPYGGEHARLAAVVAGGLPSDLLKFDDGPLVVDFIGGTRAEKNQAYTLASPARQLTPQAPPFFLFHGKWDRLVPVDHATDFYQALQAQGTPSELYLQPWRGHLASFIFRGSAMKAAVAFLNRQVEKDG
ncbi:alpha/beta hydrolase [Vreelandella zhanjiangensis]|uniref:alpha/beta hydrolase n=1 Tax=Vreelandella zhanjiangensis TaxID=1121960 RepID=UPI00037009EB|nr:alpha/beta hydrolase [Halomonas zhanjiangensis]